jgi:hypothetical protein
MASTLHWKTADLEALPYVAQTAVCGLFKSFLCVNGLRSLRAGPNLQYTHFPLSAFTK